MTHVGMVPCRRLAQIDLASCSRLSVSPQPPSGQPCSLSSTQTTMVQPWTKRSVTAKVNSGAAHSVLILQLLLLLLLKPLPVRLQVIFLQTSAAASKCCCKKELLAAAWCCCCCCSKRAYHQRQGSDLRSYDALFITFEPCLRCCGSETALLAWWLWGHEDDGMPDRFASSVNWVNRSIYVGPRKVGASASLTLLCICCSASSLTRRTTETYTVARWFQQVPGSAG